MIIDMTNWFGADRDRIKIIGDIASPIDVEWEADVNPDRVLEESGMVTDRRSGRDRRFVAEHRGGSLLRHDHHALAVWAASCAQRVLAVVWIVHMADHCLVAADYALKAAEEAGMDVERERRWQERTLPGGVRTLVMDARG